jgi:hypothetical protein
MTTATPRVPKTRHELKKSSHKSLRAMYKTVLRELILKKNYSIFDAAFKFDMDEVTAIGILFDKKPTQAQIDYALEIYNKGLSMTVACVAASVPFNIFKKAHSTAPRTEYKPKRW